MRNLTYWITFILVASGAIYRMASNWIVFDGHNPFNIVMIFASPLSIQILGQPPHIPQIAISFLQWFMLSLVLHRLYRFIRERKFAIPQAFKGAWVFMAAMGIISFLLGELAVKSFSGLYSLPDSVFYYLWEYSFPISATVLPLIFTLVELISLKGDVGAKT